MDVWVGSGLIDDVFSMCLGESGGRLVLGGVGEEYAGGAFIYTPIIAETYYVVNMSDLTVGGKSIGLPPAVYNDGDAIVDSGSTDMVLPNKAYTKLVDTLKASCKAGSALAGLCGEPAKQTIFDGYCFALNASEIAAWPTIEVSLGGGVVLSIPSTIYLTGNCGGSSGYFTIGIDAGADGDGTILGDVVMKPYTVVFDRAAKRVGFAPSKCNG